MSVFYPLQKICLAAPGPEQDYLLLLASGPELSVTSLSTGEILSQWPVEKDVEPTKSEDQPTGDANHERPSKRRKVDDAAPVNLSRQQSEASEASVEIVAERKKGERRRAKIVDEKLPNISHLLVTRDGKYLILVTTEDKKITIFSLSATGQLCVLSQRNLPKKLCAVRLTADETVILAADKFGDVYAIPLIPTQGWAARVTAAAAQSGFVPSATEFTVHTKGNLEALRQQREQTTFKQRKDAPNFEHTLILGHVSLLTDLVIAEGFVDGKLRPFILTADRDEHIRVSRGIPQAHMIEAYCLGHQEFVSKLCIIPWANDLLVAGNGEPSLRLYKWQSGKLMQTFELRDLQLPPPCTSRAPDGREADKVAISGIWPVQIIESISDGTSRTAAIILAALEGVPLLYGFKLTEQTQLQFLGCHELQGNILDVVQVGTTSEIIVSLDTIHEPCSVKNYRSEDSGEDNNLHRLRLVIEFVVDRAGTEVVKTVEWKDVDMVKIDISDCLFPRLDGVTAANGKSKELERIYSPMGEFLYGLENLRKKTITIGDEDAVEAEEVPA